MKHIVFSQMMGRDNSMIRFDRQAEDEEIPLVEDDFRLMIFLIYLAPFLDEVFLEPEEQENRQKDEEKIWSMSFI